MPPAQNPAHPWLEGEERSVPKTASTLPRRRAGWLGRPFAGVGLCVLLWAALLGVFRLNTFNQYEYRPTGDSTYFIEMTQVFYLNEPPAMLYPTMHSRRILGPWLAAQFCSLADSLAGRQPAKPFHYGYYGEDFSTNPEAEHVPTYHRILAAWQNLNAAAFLGIFLGFFGILHLFQLKQGATPWQPVWLALILCCSPTLGRLYFNWPFMNDLIGIGLGLLSILCLLKRRVIFSGLLFGAGMLARENLALIYPCFLWILFTSEQAPPVSKSRKTWLPAHLLLSFAPYILICAFPVFQNVGPFRDQASGIRQASTGAAHDYLSLILFHLRRPFIADHALLRQSVVYWAVCGPLLLLALRFYPWNRAQLTRDGLLWAAFLLVIATSFYVDRYVVYAVLPLVLLSRHRLASRLSPFLASCLGLFYLQAVLLFAKNRVGDDLQVEFMYATRLKWLALWGACALFLVALEPVLRARLVSLTRKTALNQQAAVGSG
jgi:hypothetical protein